MKQNVFNEDITIFLSKKRDPRCTSRTHKTPLERFSSLSITLWSHGLIRRKNQIY